VHIRLNTYPVFHAGRGGLAVRVDTMEVDPVVIAGRSMAGPCAM
jgi:hypothetical protein